MEHLELNRRNFLKSIGTLSLAMVPDFSRGPLEKLYPLLVPAEEIIPGTAYWYTSTCRECPPGCGVMLKARDGNVIKIEGNPNHPISRGGLCLRGQAALQELYNPERLQQPLKLQANAAESTMNWSGIAAEIQGRMDDGEIVFLTGNVTGSQKQYIEIWLGKIPGKSHLIIYEPFARSSMRHANELVFGLPVAPVFHPDQADFVLSFGADFMETWISPVELSNKFAASRRYHAGKSAKLVYLGSIDTLTAANADEVYSILPGTEIIIMLALAKWLLENSEKITLSATEKANWLQSLAPFSIKQAAQLSELPVEKLQQLAKQLKECQNGLVLCGDSVAAHKQGTQSQVAANILNYIAGHYGETISPGNSDSARSRDADLDFEQLIGNLDAGKISTLIIHQTNPLFTYPDIDRLRNALQKVKLKIALVTTMNETAALADYVLPIHHTIETWGIESPGNDIHSLVQPGMEPVFNTKPLEEILQTIKPVADLPATNEEFVKSEWAKRLKKNNGTSVPDSDWRAMLIKGGMWQADRPSAPPKAPSGIHRFLRTLKLPIKSAGITLAVNPSHRFYDGRGANKSWLWEIPDALHQTVWETPLRIHPELAKENGLKEGDILKITANDESIEAPVLITPDIHPSVVAMEIGGGHTNYGKSAISTTGNPLKLLPCETDPVSGDAVLFAQDIKLSATGKWRKIVRLQGGYDQGERGIIQVVSLSKAIEMEKAGARRTPANAPKIYPEHQHKTYDWTMVIDLSACNGCGACVAACYAENNIPVVGKHQCDRGREMAWIRIERFEVEGHPRFIPMMCQQCEAAPCETVCPVYATVHSDE
ncbi:molybdopterin-dependent oxidoreductase, partial [candidate division KSB1 bacterium]|nr:molybdopterin-dependent oxidoreductase [candidate division KSB1 bacterium]